MQVLHGETIGPWHGNPRGRPKRPQDAAGQALNRTQRMKLCEQAEHPLVHLHLGHDDADPAVGVDEEVGAESAGPAEPTAAGSPVTTETPNPQPVLSQKPG